MKQIADIDGAPVRAVATERGPGGREPRRVRDAARGGGRRRGRGHLRGRGGPPHPPRRAAGACRSSTSACCCATSAAARTEVLVGQQGQVLAARSFKLGAVRLTNRFFAGERLHPSAVVVVPHVRPLDPLALRQGGRGARLRGGGRLVGHHPGGRRDRAGGDGRRADPARSTASALTSDEVRAVAKAPRRRPEHQAAGPHPRRSTPTAPTSSSPAPSSSRACSRPSASTSSRCQRVRAARGRPARHHPALRAAAPSTTCATSRGAASCTWRELCDEEPEHSAHVARLALELFDQLTALPELHRARGPGRAGPGVPRGRRAARQRGAVRLPQPAPPALVLRDPQHRGA